MLALLEEIVKEQSREQGDEQLIQLLFTSLIILLARERPSEYLNTLSEKRRKQFLKFLSLLGLNYTQTRDAQNYAAMMYISYKTLNQICQQASQQSAKQLIDAHLTLEAKRKLVVEDIHVLSSRAICPGNKIASSYSKEINYEKNTFNHPCSGVFKLSGPLINQGNSFSSIVP